MALLLRSQARWARAGVEVEVEVEARAHKLEIQGPMGVSTPLHHKLRL